MIERRFEQLRKACGSNAALERLSNAAFLLGYQKEFDAAATYREKEELVAKAAGVEAGHKLANILRHKEVIPPLSYRSVVRKAARDLGIAVLKNDAAEDIEKKLVTRLLLLRDDWDPASSAHRARLVAELNRAMRERNAGIKGKLTRALETGLQFNSIKTSLRGLPAWARKGSGAAIVASGLYGAYKLGQPNAERVLHPLILLMALARADIEAARVAGSDCSARAQ